MCRAYKGNPVVYGLKGVAEVAKEEDEVFSPFSIDDLIGKLQRQDNGHVNGEEASYLNEDPLIDKIPWRMTETVEDGMFVRRTLDSRQQWRGQCGHFD